MALTTRLVLAACVVVGWVAAVNAAGPTIIMVYGDRIQKPVFLVRDRMEDFTKLACQGPGELDPARFATERPHYKLAIFWISDVAIDPSRAASWLPKLTAEQASQHGRIYPQAGDGLPVVVATNVSFTSEPTNERTPRGEPINLFVGLPQPVPTSGSKFVKACQLTKTDIEALRRAGVPGL
jgi:hypothetical protein